MYTFWMGWVEEWGGKEAIYLKIQRPSLNRVSCLRDQSSASSAVLASFPRFLSLQNLPRVTITTHVRTEQDNDSLMSHTFNLVTIIMWSQSSMIHTSTWLINELHLYLWPWYSYTDRVNRSRDYLQGVMILPEVKYWGFPTKRFELKRPFGWEVKSLQK